VGGVRCVEETVAVVINMDYLITVVKLRMKMAGSSLSHIGFGLMIIGIMASGLNKHFISKNPFAQRGLVEGFTEEDYQRNIVLLKGVPMFMSGYEVTYMSDTVDVFTRTFNVNYKKRDLDGNVIEEFNLNPNILYDKGFTKVAASNPSTKHYWYKDIFTHVTSLHRAEIDPEFARSLEDSLKCETYDANIGDTNYPSQHYAILQSINRQPTHPDYEPQEKDLAVGMKLAVRRLGMDSSWIAEPVLVLRKNLLYSYPAQINDISVKVRLPEAIFERIFESAAQLDFMPYPMKQGESILLNGHEIKFVNFNTSPEHPNYTPQEDDIAVGALLEVKFADGKTVKEIEPIYLIRGKRPYNIQAQLDEIGLHFNFSKIDPTTGSITMEVAQGEDKIEGYPFEIAENSARRDYIVMEAIVFPGINYFWVGTILMMLGLAVSMWYRMQQKQLARGTSEVMTPVEETADAV